MATLDDQIELAQRHVTDGRRIVAAQRGRIVRGEVSGSTALELLATFEKSQQIFEQDLDRLLAQRNSKGH